MRILPVLDLKDGHVVRGVGGRRQEYRPVVSRLTTSSRPAAVARALRDHFGFAELYVADLDAIAGLPAALAIYAELRAGGFRLWVDAGVRDGAEATALAAAGIERIVVGLETVAGPADLENICRSFGGERVVFSLDLKEGMPLGEPSAWGSVAPWPIAVRAVAAGVHSLIVLDLARVGVGTGTGTEDLCTQLAAAYPEVEVIAGGGVRNVADLQRLRKCGIRAVLVASALHDGCLRPEDLASF